MQTGELAGFLHAVGMGRNLDEGAGVAWKDKTLSEMSLLTI